MDRQKYRTKFQIITLEISEEGQILEFTEKLPNHFECIKGIFANVSRKEGDFDDIEQMGEISIQLNSKKISPFHIIVDFQRRPKTENPLELELNEEIQPNQLVTGYYRDYKQSKDRDGRFRNYTLKIYFKCRIRE